MENNKKYSIGILLAFAVIAIFTVVWGMYLNYGELIVESQAPYSVSLLGGPAKDCETNKCSLQAKPGFYTMTVSKTGHSEYKTNIEIDRFSSATVAADLVFIPKVEVLDKSPFAAGQAKVEASKEQVPASALASYINPLTGNFVYLAVDLQNKQALFLSQKGVAKAIAYFPRKISTATLTLSDNEEKVFIVENAEKENIIYLVNISDLSKQQVFSTPDKITGVKVSPSGQNAILVTENESLGTSAYLIDATGKSAKIALREPLEWFAWLNDEELLFMSTENFGNSAGGTESNEQIEEGISFEEYLYLFDHPELNDESIENETVADTIYFYSYEISGNLPRKIISYQLPQAGVMPLKFEVLGTSESPQIYFSDQKNKSYQLVLNK